MTLRCLRVSRSLLNQVVTSPNHTSYLKLIPQRSNVIDLAKFSSAPPLKPKKNEHAEVTSDSPAVDEDNPDEAKSVKAKVEDVLNAIGEKDKASDKPSRFKFKPKAREMLHLDGTVMKLPEGTEGAVLQQWEIKKADLKDLPTYYLMLSKSRLTMLVCATAAAGYGLAPAPLIPEILLISTIGTYATNDCRKCPL